MKVGICNVDHAIIFGSIILKMIIVKFFNYNKKKDEEKRKQREQSKVHPYGDDTV